MRLTLLFLLLCSSNQRLFFAALVAEKDVQDAAKLDSLLLRPFVLDAHTDPTGRLLRRLLVRVGAVNEDDAGKVEAPPDPPPTATSVLGPLWRAVACGADRHETEAALDRRVAKMGRLLRTIERNKREAEAGEATAHGACASSLLPSPLASRRIPSIQQAPPHPFPPPQNTHTRTHH